MLSTDGGQTWQATAERAGGFDCTLSFADTETGWAHSSDRGLEATADGGATWEELVLPDGVGEVVAISLRTPEDGYLLDTDSGLHVTQDGGKTWSLMGTVKREDGSEITGLLPAQAAVRFLDADHGMVVVDLGKPGMTVLRTRDGGQTWQEESLGVDWAGPYLSHDGKLVALVTIMDPEIVVLQYQGE